MLSARQAIKAIPSCRGPACQTTMCALHFNAMLFCRHILWWRNGHLVVWLMCTAIVPGRVHRSVITRLRWDVLHPRTLAQYTRLLHLMVPFPSQSKVRFIISVYFLPDSTFFLPYMTATNSSHPHTRTVLVQGECQY